LVIRHRIFQGKVSHRRRNLTSAALLQDGKLTVF
jgi:hypothetical protein